MNRSFQRTVVVFVVVSGNGVILVMSVFPRPLIVVIVIVRRRGRWRVVRRTLRVMGVVTRALLLAPSVMAASGVMSRTLLIGVLSVVLLRIVMMGTCALTVGATVARVPTLLFLVGVVRLMAVARGSVRLMGVVSLPALRGLPIVMVSVLIFRVMRCIVAVVERCVRLIKRVLLASVSAVMARRERVM
jgi:hypothetical protein